MLMNQVANNKVSTSGAVIKSGSAGIAKLIAVAALVTLVGCSSGKWGFPYRAPTQQGNWVTAEQVSYLRQGFTKDQVLYALGTPTLVDIFHPNRWDYPYHYKPGYGKPVHRNLSLWFDENDLLERWAHDPLPEGQPADFETQRSSISATPENPEFDASAAATEEGFQTTPLAE